MIMEIIFKIRFAVKMIFFWYNANSPKFSQTLGVKNHDFVNERSVEHP